MKLPDLTALQAVAVGVVAVAAVLRFVAQPVLAGRLLALRMANLAEDVAADPRLAAEDPAQVRLLVQHIARLQGRPASGAAEVRRSLSRPGGGLNLPAGRAIEPYRRRLLDALADHCDATVMPWSMVEARDGLARAGVVRLPALRPVLQVRGRWVAAALSLVGIAAAGVLGPSASTAADSNRRPPTRGATHQNEDVTVPHP